MKERIVEFQQLVWDFYKKNKRDFPWRYTTDPYKILVSEVMLQQTQADRVALFYKKWLKRFPNFKSLAKARFSEIYPFWQGLGYNRRALNLQKTAQKVLTEYKGKLPKDVLLLEEFPGIGPYTAKAVAIFSWNMPISCIETNIRRVFIHHFFTDKNNIDDKEILKLAEQCLPQRQSTKISRKFGTRPRTYEYAEWHWALMDYGAYLKSAVKNPNRRAKSYSIQPKFEGSLREIRGAMLRSLMEKKMTVAQLVKMIDKDTQKTKNVVLTLEKEGLIKSNKKFYLLN